jgi:hypothetical protein
MAVTKEEFQLIVQAVGEEILSRLGGKLDLVNKASERVGQASGSTAAAQAKEAASVYDLADAYEVLEAEHRRSVTATQQESQAATQTVAAQEKAGEAAKNAGKKIREVAGDTRVARQGFVDIARASQDFAQGGFAAIVNNLEGIGRGLTSILANPAALLSSLPALLTLVGVAVLAFGEKIAKVGSMIRDVWNPDRIKTIQTDVEKLNERIKELKDKSIKLAVDTIELEGAEKKLKELLKLENDWEARQKQQTPGEAEAGRLTKERLELEEGGIGKVQEDLKQKFMREFTENSPVLKNIADEMAAAAQGYVRDQLTGVRIFVGRGMTGDYERMLTEQGAEERQRIAKSAQAEATRLLNAPIEGKGGQMAAGRKTLAKQLQELGRGNLAADIAGTTPEALKEGDEADKRFEESMDRAKAAGERRRTKAAAAKDEQTQVNREFHETLKDELATIEESGDLKGEVDRLLTEAKKQKLTGKALYESLKAGLTKYLQGQLKDVIAPAGAGAGAFEPVEDLIGRTARQGRIAAETEARREQGAAGRAATKEARGEAKGEAAAADRLAEQMHRGFAAEAGRITDALGGKQLAEQLKVQAAAGAGTPEENARALAQRLARGFMDQGATKGGAITAAQQIARQAGFALEFSDVNFAEQAQRPRGRVARRPKPVAGGQAPIIGRGNLEGNEAAQAAIKAQTEKDAERRAAAGAQQAAAIAAETAASNARIAARVALMQRQLAAAKSKNAQADRRLNESQPTALNFGGPN